MQLNNKLGLYTYVFTHAYEATFYSDRRHQKIFGNYG